MSFLAAAGVAGHLGNELFKYNRENFKFDQDQRIERETLRLEMQVKRFELFREDVRDLVELTVDRMDVYHLVGALFLEFCVVLFCEGRVQASAPPFLLSLFLLSNACSFIYLLLAVWLSMHASIASHSFGVRLLTRFVRLPIPSMKQMAGLTSNLKDFERQGIGNLLKMPFLNSKNTWYEDGQGEEKISELEEERAAAALLDQAAMEEKAASSGKLRYLATASPDRDGKSSSRASAGAVEMASVSPLPDTVGRSNNSSDAGSRVKRSPDKQKDLQLLPEVDEAPIGGEDLLSGQTGALPDRHVQLFRQLQSKWQCYDAYCRVCMGLGVNQILQALSYYSICHTLVENRSPSTGYAMVVLFQCTTVALAVLDLAGLKRREIVAIQIVGIMPCFFTAWGVAHGERNEHGVLNPDQMYYLSPFAFLAQVLWLELWIRVAAPSADKAKLPRRFRQVLFLDVFGDAVGWDPTNAENEEVPEHRLDRPMDFSDWNAPADDEAELEFIESSAEEASSQIQLAQWAMRRWGAVPTWAFSRAQRSEYERLYERFISWRSTGVMELSRRGSAAIEAEFRTWIQLDQEERATDPFGKCLVGPFDHDGGYEKLQFHFDIERQATIFEANVSKECPGALLLTLAAVDTIVQDLERSARELLEARIVYDLKSENKKRELAIRDRERKRRESNQGTIDQVVGAAPVLAAEGLFPNIRGMFRRASTGEDGEGLLSASTGSPTPAHAVPLTYPSPPAHEASSASNGSNGPARPCSPISRRDPTLVAMAGKHARHFVPERLPWQVLKGMTRVLQLGWFFTGLMAFLKEANIYTIDFQQHAGGGHGGRRLLCLQRQWNFEYVDVQWPHGSFFRPQSVFCPALGSNDFVIGSPFAVYSAGDMSSTPVQLNEVGRSRLPASTIMICAPQVHAQATALQEKSAQCIFSAPTQDGLAFWPSSDSHGGPNTITLAIDGAPWKMLAGAIVHCANVSQFLIGEESMAHWCLMLAGWDGEMLPISVLPLPDASSLMPSAGMRVRPSLDAPLLPKDAKEGLQVLHMEGTNGRLWAIKANGELEAWDILRSQSFGHLKMQWPTEFGIFRPTGLCEDVNDGQLLAVGRSDSQGPLLFRASLPPMLGDGAFKASSRLFLQELHLL